MSASAKNLDWYRQLGAPGVEFRIEVAKGTPTKMFCVRVRSIADPKMESTHLVANIQSTPITSILVSAQIGFARQLEQRVLDERRRRHESIASRDAAERRTLDEGNVPKPERAGEGKPVQNDEVPANTDAKPAEESDAGAGRDPKGRGSRRQGKQKAGPVASPAVPPAGS